MTLKLPGDTRATSTANCLTSVSRSRPLLRAMVTSDEWDDYVDPKKMTKKEDRDKANTIQRLVRHQPSMDGIEVFGRFLTLIQVWQRVVAKRNKTLSDAVYDTAEVLKRIDAFEGVSDSVKAKMKGAIVFRFDKVFYSPAVALACCLDPRFNFRMEGLDVSWSSQHFEEDAVACLEQKTKHLPSSTRDKIMEQYGDLREGRVFRLSDPDDARRLREASDMPLWKWARLQKLRPSCTELFQYLSVPIFSLPIVADGCEHSNSIYKWVQACRVALSDENARRLVYILINTRLLKQFKELEDVERVAGGFKPGWGWPPVSDLADEALAAALAEADPEIAATQASLRDAINEMAAAAAEDAAAGSAASPTRTSPRLAARRRNREEAFGGDDE